MYRKCNFIIYLLAIFLLVNSVNLIGQTKKRVAVFAFEDKTDHRWHWWTGQPVGEGMADMLTTELVKSGKYQVIERQAIEKIMQEQQLGQTGMVTPQSAAQVGQLLGVELAIIGSVTEFGHKQSDVVASLKSRDLDLACNRLPLRLESMSDLSIPVPVKSSLPTTSEKKRAKKA